MKDYGSFRYVMTKNGLIAYDKSRQLTVRLDRKETNDALSKKIDYSKYDEHCEVAHLEISNTCNLDCAYCYVPHKNGNELKTSDWKKIIKNLANAGLFQVSFGGGEPTLRKDLFELARYVDKCGLNLGMTTNGSMLKELDPVLLRKYFKQINVSWHNSPEVFEEALEFLFENEIPRGINYCYSKELARWEHIVRDMALEYSAEMLYLVYKPVINDTKNQIPPEDVYRAAKRSANLGIRVAVDGPCVNQCLMKQKFVDVNHRGDVFGCSFIRTPIGNLLKQDFKEIWEFRGSQVRCPYVKFRKEEK